MATGLLSFSLLLVASRLWKRDDVPIVPAVVRPHDPTVDVWVGEFEPGVTVVFASPWNQQAWDAASDETLRASRAAAPPADLVLYDCWLFNATDRPVAVSLAPGSLAVTARDGRVLPLRSLASWLAPTEGPAPEGGAAAVFRALGAGRDRIDLPPGRMHRHPVALERRVALGEVTSVARADGSPFRLRRMRETEWVALIQSPSRSELEILR